MSLCVTFYRQLDGGANPAPKDYEKKIGKRGVGSWGQIYFDIGGMLEKEAKAICVSLNCGYPDVYTAQVKNLMPLIENSELCGHELWNWGPDSEGHVRPIEPSVNHGKLGQLRPDEWLVLIIWDSA